MSQLTIESSKVHVYFFVHYIHIFMVNSCFCLEGLEKSSPLKVQVQMAGNLLQIIYVRSSTKSPHLVLLQQKTCMGNSSF